MPVEGFVFRSRPVLPDRWALATRALVSCCYDSTGRMSMPGRKDVAPFVADLPVARDFHHDLLDAEIVDALAEERQDLVVAGGKFGDALIDLAEELSGEGPAIRPGDHCGPSSMLLDDDRQPDAPDRN